jgi:hypothetical protein
MKNFEKIVNQSLDIMNIQISKKDENSGDNILNAIKSYYEVLIYNVVSIAVVIALANNSKKITIIQLDHVKDYIKSKCLMKKKRGSGGSGGSESGNNQTGGTSLPAEYFGYSIDPARYAVANGGEQSTATVNFEAGVLRPEIATSTNYTGAITGGTAAAVAAFVGGGCNCGLGMRSGGGNADSLNHFICTNKEIKSYVREILKRHSLSISKDALDHLLHMIEVHIVCALKDLKVKSPITLAKVNSVFKTRMHSIFN